MQIARRTLLRGMAASALTGSLVGRAAAADDILIGVPTAQSTPVVVGDQKDWLKGVTLAIDEFNAAGGVAGRKSRPSYRSRHHDAGRHGVGDAVPQGQARPRVIAASRSRRKKSATCEPGRWTALRRSDTPSLSTSPKSVSRSPIESHGSHGLDLCGPRLRSGWLTPSACSKFARTSMIEASRRTCSKQNGDGHDERTRL